MISQNFLNLHICSFWVVRTRTANTKAKLGIEIKKLFRSVETRTEALNKSSAHEDTNGIEKKVSYLDPCGHEPWLWDGFF